MDPEFGGRQAGATYGRCVKMSSKWGRKPHRGEGPGLSWGWVVGGAGSRQRRASAPACWVTCHCRTIKDKGEVQEGPVVGSVQPLADVVGAKGHFFRGLTEPECSPPPPAPTLTPSTWIPPPHFASLSLGISPQTFPAPCSNPQNGRGTG